MPTPRRSAREPARRSPEVHAPGMPTDRSTRWSPCATADSVPEVAPGLRTNRRRPLRVLPAGGADERPRRQLVAHGGRRGHGDAPIRSSSTPTARPTSGTPTGGSWMSTKSPGEQLGSSHASLRCLAPTARPKSPASIARPSPSSLALQLDRRIDRPRRLVSNDHTHPTRNCCRRRRSRCRCVSPFGLGGGQGPLGIPQPAAKAGRSGDWALDGGSDRLGCPDQDQASTGSGHCGVQELSGENW